MLIPPAIILHRRSSLVTIQVAAGVDREAVFKALDRRFSYPVEGAFFSPAYKSGVWDGRIHLVRKARGNLLKLPGGLYAEACELLKAKGWELQEHDERPLPTPWAKPLSRWEWHGHKLRDYQRETVRAARASEGGVLNLAIRAGKTLVAAKLFSELASRALFVVTSNMLLAQAAQAFRGALPYCRVTEVGDDCMDATGDIVVASMQSLSAMRTNDPAQFAELASAFQTVVLDEVHHITGDGDAWRDTAMALEPRRKFGLSATIELSKRKASNSGAVWLRAVCGPVLYSLGMSELIERGWLVRPTVRFVRHGAPELSGTRWRPDLLKEAIDLCHERNLRIAQEALAQARAGRRVLVDVARVLHAQEVASLLDRLQDRLPVAECVRFSVLLGKTPKALRERAMAWFRSGEVPIIVGTLLGEGVDVPELEVVINAEGGKAKVGTVQRLRNLTASPGKTEALVVELVDTHHPHLRKWTAERLAIYRAEPAFRIEIEVRK